MPKSLIMALLLGLSAAVAHAQPFNVRAWYAQGQVFVVWRFPVPPVVLTNTVEIYASPAAQANTANMTRAGRMFFPEYTGSRLAQLQPAARLLVPAPGGATYRLALDEGCFVYTPHAAGNLFFAVVDTGAAAVNANNSAATAFAYDPVNNPVRAHPQFNGFTAGGNPYTAFVFWIDGRPDHNDSRPDYPVFGNQHKNGVPQVFAVTRPIGALPAGPVPATLVLHGGDDNYALFRPGVAARANMSLGMTGGVVITPDDSLFLNLEGNLAEESQGWFGYAASFDPFDALPRAEPDGSTPIVNYRHRMLHWMLEWFAGPNSPQPIDPDRVAGVGHSAGGRGISHVTRARPELFSSVVCYCPASYLAAATGGQVNYLRGNWDSNLPTNVVGPGGMTLGVTDVYTSTTRISATERDFPLTRFYYGKRDEKEAAAWSADQRGVVDALNDSRMGCMIYWDEREHGVEAWDEESNDAIDMHAGPWPDVAQWIVPPVGIGGGKTRLPSAENLADADRASASYPGFFNSDTDPIAVGRQPDPGTGDPDNGDSWGTWTGYFDWDRASIVDEVGRWEGVIFSTGFSITPVDNSIASETSADVTPRRTQNFNPAEGTLIRWYVVEPILNQVVSFGTSVAEADGVVEVAGIVVAKDPARRRLVLCADSTCIGDADGNGGVNFADITSVLANFGSGFVSCNTPGDSDKNGVVNFADVTSTLASFNALCP